MINIFKKHKLLWPQRSFWFAVVVGALFLVLSLLATYLANSYTIEHASNSVSDIILDNVPTMNVGFVFSEGAMIFFAILILIGFYEPRRIPFALKTIALFIAVRSVFLILTHLAPPTQGSYVDTSDLIYKISSGDDLFFSAHTGLPFLLAVMFWKERYFRYFFLLSTAIGGTAVLLGHLHYSIDVFSALFIAFGTFHAAKYLFPDDRGLFEAEVGVRLSQQK